MQRPDLFLHIDILDHVESAIALLDGRAVVARRGLLPSSRLLLRDGLAGHAVEQVAALRGQALEIAGHVLRREVRGCETAVGFGFLFLPAGVEELN